MKTVQEIFDTVIDCGVYANDEYTHMCPALTEAYYTGMITIREYHLAQDAIDDYLQGEYALSIFLDKKGLQSGFYCRLAIYRNWEQRPKFGKVRHEHDTGNI